MMAPSGEGRSTALGSFSITFSKTRAGPSGTRQPCSQSRNVPGGIPKRAENSACDNPEPLADRLHVDIASFQACSSPTSFPQLSNSRLYSGAVVVRKPLQFLAQLIALGVREIASARYHGCHCGPSVGNSGARRFRGLLDAPLVPWLALVEVSRHPSLVGGPGLASAVRLPPVNDIIMRVAEAVPVLLLGFAPLALARVHRLRQTCCGSRE